MKRLPRDASGRRFLVLCGVLVGLLAIWNTRQVLGFELLAWDDDNNIVFNAHLGSFSWPSLKWMFTDFAYLRYMPLGWLALSSLRAVGGLCSAGYHAANLALHGVNTVLLFLVLGQMLRRWSRAVSEPWRTTCAAVAAAAWALHPFRNETVGWASGLLYSLPASFGLLAVLVRCAVEADTAARRRWVAGLYACSVFVYPTSIGLVVVFFLMDLADEARGAAAGRRPYEWARLIQANRWGGAVAVLAAAATLGARLTADATWTKAATLDGDSPWLRGMRACYACVHFLGSTLWPGPATPAPTQMLRFSPWELRAWASAAVVIGLTWLLIGRRSWRAGPLWFWLGYGALLLPTLGLTESLYFACARYAYLPDMAASAALAFALARAPQRWRVTLLATASAVVVAFLAVQRAQLPIWRNSDTLFEQITSVAGEPDYQALMFNRWMLFHAQRGELRQARAVLAESQRRCPGQPQVARAAAMLAKYETAAGAGWPAGSGVARLADLHAKTAMEFLNRGEIRRADEHFRAVLALAPDSSTARFNDALMWAVHGDAARALHLYLGLRPEMKPAIASANLRGLLTVMAQAFAAEGREVAARQAREWARRENPLEQNHSSETGSARWPAEAGSYRCLLLTRVIQKTSQAPPPVSSRVSDERHR